jgi:hypothetical protein
MGVPRNLSSFALGGVCLAGVATLAVLAPLATYSVTLAVFGLPHVLSELRYIDRRFGRRLDKRFLLPIAVLLQMIVAVRASVVFHVAPLRLGLPAELFGVAALALVCARGPNSRKGLALPISGAIGGATAVAPYATVATLSILHNLTPLGFLWQIAPPARRGRIMFAAVLAFLGLPLLVATGWPAATLGRLLGFATDFDPLQGGALDDQLFVYVPPSLIDSAQAVDLFTASVVAQGAHYATVIALFPLLLARLDPRARGLVDWPANNLFACVCAFAAIVSVVRHLDGFADARALYGVAASAHVWIEIPVLILAPTGAAQPSIQTPARKDPELASNETIIARSTRSPAIQAMRQPSTSTTTASSARTDGQ